MHKVHTIDQSLICSGEKPFWTRTSFIRPRWLPCSSTELPFTVPPHANFDLRYVDSSCRSISFASKPSTTVTSLPYLRLFTFTVIRCCSFATSSHIHSSDGKPQTGHISELIFWYFLRLFTHLYTNYINYKQILYLVNYAIKI